MKCKFCFAEIEEDALRCPCCGKELKAPVEEAPVEEALTEEVPIQETVAEEPAKAKKATPGKIALAVAAIVVLVGILVALIFTGMQSKTTQQEEVVVETVEETTAPTIPEDGEPGTVREKGSYSAADEDVIAAKDTVVATMGDKTLTNSQLQIYYWMGYHNFLTSNYSYVQYFGLDLTQPLDVQIMEPMLHGEDDSMTWQQYFLQFALNSWQQVQAVALAAEEAGMEMEAEDQQMLDNLVATVEEAIAGYGVTLEDYLAMNFGPGAGIGDYKKYQDVYYQGAPYYAAETVKLVPTDEELEAYFAEHEEDYASGGITRDTRLVDVRHILLKPENAKEDGTYADEDWAACEKKAQDLLEGYLAGETTEEAFAALANEHSTDPGSNTNGGLYEDVYEGQMMPTFNDWCFDAGRKPGDTGLVKTDYGYHIMYFVEGHEDVWKEYATSDWVSEKTNALLEAVIAAYPMEVAYDKILIGNLAEQQ